MLNKLKSRKRCLTSKQIFKITVMLLCLTMMLCIWPFCLVRKEAAFHGNTGGTIEETTQNITHATPYSQTFIAQESKLENIIFILGWNVDQLPAEGCLQFELFDSENKSILSRTVDFEDVVRYGFTTVPVDKWIHKGEEYTFRVSVNEEYDNLFCGIYTTAPEDHTPGNINFCMGDVLIEGQSVSGCGYGYPLNIKNIVCLWGFLLAVGLSVFNMAGGFDATCKRAEKMRALWNKVCGLVKRYELWILLFEMVVILAMTIYICRNITLDWDEAYSVQMITKYSFLEMFRVTAEDIHPPLYYILLRLFSMVFGTGVFALKLLSVLFTGLVMLLSITKIRKNWGGAAAFLFNLVVGLGPQFNFYSVNIRMYSLSLFFVMWCALLAYDIIQGKGKCSWVLFVLSALGGAYTHYFNVVPLAFVCGYLLIGLIVERRKDCKYFLGVCAGIILGYLPWLSIVISSFKREGTTGQIDFGTVDFGELIDWSFTTNIKYSESMPVMLLIFAVIMFVLEWKRIPNRDKLFLGMCVFNLPFSYVACKAIASMNRHFWADRYVFAALGTIWLFIILMYVRRGRLVVCALTMWLSVTVLSSFTINKAMELGTNAYMADTYKTLEQVREEEVILYNYDTFEVLYGAHLREQEFVYINDFDWDNYEKDYVYFIAWGGHNFSSEVYEKYKLQLVDCGTMRFDEGVAGVRLYKVLINAGK